MIHFERFIQNIYKQLPPQSIMKKRFDISLRDFALIKLTIILGTLFILGLLMNWFSALKITLFLINWRWGFFALALIIGIRPVWKMLFGLRSMEGLPEKKVVTKKVKKKR